MQWVSRITTIGIEMVLFGILGRWADQRMGTSLLGPLGFLLGFLIGGYHLLRLTAAPSKHSSADDTSTKNPQ